MAPVHEEGLKGECEDFPRISNIEHEFFVECQYMLDDRQVFVQAGQDAS